MRDVERAILSAAMFEAGIVPMEQTHLDMRRALDQLPPEEARAMKRKFRKLWRKAMAKAMASPGLSLRDKARLSRELGIGDPIPSRDARSRRKRLVFDEVWKGTVQPLVKRFDSPDGRTGEDESEGS